MAAQYDLRGKVAVVTGAGSGIGRASAVELLGTDSTGANVFFYTEDQLVPQDTDTQLDLYDARIGGGFPYSPPTAKCDSDACQGTPSLPPPIPAAASIVFSGSSNPSLGTTPAKVEVLGRVVHGSKLLLRLNVPARGRPSRAKSPSVATEPSHATLFSAQPAEPEARFAKSAVLEGKLGAPPGTMFRRVLWPLALPGILAGTILTFILAMNAYATPFLLGGPLFKMMAPVLYNEFTQKTNWPFGGAIAFILMAVTLTLTIVANLVLQRRAAR